MPHSLPPFTAESTLRDLPLHYFQVVPQTQSQWVAQQFEQEQWLPGVVIADKHQFIGMISRRRFHEWMNSSYGVEVLLEQPISMFLELTQLSQQTWQAPETLTVSEALDYALDRNVDEIYEPIVVKAQERVISQRPTYFLLEFQSLIRAQTQITQHAYQELRQHRKDLNRYVQRLGQSQAQVQQYVQRLRAQAEELRLAEALPSLQVWEQEESFQDLQQVTQRLLDTSKHAITNSQQAFQGTLGGISIIVQNTQDIVEIGQLLDAELGKVQTASHLVRNISQQIRQLAVQATIVANQTDTQLTGFSSITNEIGQMISQTLEAGREMELIASRFTQKLHDLTTSAQGGMKAARSLIRKVQRAEAAINELESVAAQALGEDDQNQIPKVSVLPDSGDTGLGAPDRPQELAQKITSLEGALAKLAKLAQHHDASHLVRKIQRTLAYHRATQHCIKTKP